MTDIFVSAIATAASHGKKPTKAVAHEKLKEIIETMGEQYIDSSAKDALASLYAYFMPKAPAKPKSDFEWVAKAVAKDDARYYLNWVYVTEKHIVGTDGHRLHMARNWEGLEPGFYDVSGVRCHDPNWAQYPNYERVVPDPVMNGEYSPYEINKDALDVHVKDDKLKFFKLPDCHGNEENGPHVDRDYFLAAMSMEKSSANVWIAKKESTIRLDLPGGRTAVVMPLRQ
ncbi:hypothetical protein GCM10007160_18470 [Litchfieldella qijiaojingensis]|uniref:Uncharacterized protein n=1 Tax=Litchfieldella qijiaojingensis TaxID=980347 RepID=A0ABQ2YSW0_9GAMM|nr:hypothetical protein [Halomonas qijiaojingensis]GGX91279.1 hypothetical protein GCM10007160_18470 [Halomonas qijiaojingensis]